MPRSPRTLPLLKMLGHTTVVLVLLTTAYFLVPLRIVWTHGADLSRLLGTIAAMGLLALLFFRTLRKSRLELPVGYRRILWLLSGLYVLVLVFAITYAALATHLEDQFVGLENRVDALYFSVTLVSTVGFGDIHAAGGAARLLTTVHMLFNFIYVGTALRVLTYTGPAEAPLASGPG